MKSLSIYKRIAAMVFVFCMALTSWSQQEIKGMKQVFDYHIDELGNAIIEVSMKLNASQWDMFKRNVGNNQSIMKREIEKALPKYYLSDFSYTEDAMDRSYKIKFKALGLASINNNGRWEAKLEMKDPDITKLSEREFVINTDMAMNGVLIQQTQKIHLPSGVSDAKVEKDSFGKAVMTYSAGGNMMSKASMIGGILLIVAGGVLFFFNSRPPKNKLRVADKESMVA